MTTIPGGAFPDCEKLETPNLLRPDGKPATAFKSRSNALVAIRSATIELQSEVAALKAFKAEVMARPF